MLSIIDRSFDINFKIMSVLGLYFSTTPSPIRRTLTYLGYFLFLVIPPLLTFLYFLFGEELDMAQVNFNAGFIVEVTGFTMKTFPFIWRSQRIRKCIYYFDGPDFVPKSKEEKKIVEDCIRTCRRNARLICPLVAACVLSWSLRPLLREGRTLHLDIWLPFDAKENIKNYCIAFVYTTMAMIYGACIVLIDALIGGLTHHASGQLMILHYNLQNLSKDEYTYHRIVQCIKHHHKILTFVDDFEDCFTFAIFSQFAGSSFAICFACLQLSLVPLSNINSAVTSIGGIFVALMQIYFYCYYGTMLYEESNNLPDAIYSSEWYKYDEKSKQALITLMIFSRKPIILTAGKILDLSLDTFTTVMKRSYSITALLKKYQ